MSLSPNHDDEREFDVVLLGATGWTGVHCAEYLVEHYGPASGVRWALAGRSEGKLAALRKRLAQLVDEPWVSDIPLLLCDNLDDVQVDMTAQLTHVIASVVGPFAQFGNKVVAACAEHGTSYVDITGETQWIREVIQKYDAPARASGALIVPSCGFDSVPSDLGALLAVQYAQSELRAKCTSVRVYMSEAASNNRQENATRGEKPGAGTLVSLLEALRGSRGTFLDPYVLIPDKSALRRVSDAVDADRRMTQMLPGHEGQLPSSARWTTHFPMSWVNEKTVRRSAFLMPELYGRDFSYREGLAVSNVVFAVLISAAFTVLYALMLVPGFVALLLKYVVPAQSQTPPERPRKYKPGKMGWRVIADTDQGHVITGVVRGCDEGGYTETAKMLLESAVCLATQKQQVVEASGFSGGIVTPAVLGLTLIERLRAQNMTFMVTSCLPAQPGSAKRRDSTKKRT